MRGGGASRNVPLERRQQRRGGVLVHLLQVFLFGQYFIDGQDDKVAGFRQKCYVSFAMRRNRRRHVFTEFFDRVGLTSVDLGDDLVRFYNFETGQKTAHQNRCDD